MGDGKTEVTVTNHPELASQFILSINKEYKLISDEDALYIANAIKKHMGQWDNFNLEDYQNDGEKILHVADYMASRKNLQILFENKEHEKILPKVNEYVVNFGKYNGKRFDEIPKDYLIWCNENIKRPIFSSMLKKYLKGLNK